MALVFITGSTDGLGRAAALSLLKDGHQVVLHARTEDRAATLGELASRASGIVLGDLRSAAQTRSIADQVNADRAHGRGHPQRRRIYGGEPRLEPRRSRWRPGSQHAGAVHPDGAGPSSRSAGLPQQRPASRWGGFAAGYRLDEAHLGSGKGLCRE